MPAPAIRISSLIPFVQLHSFAGHAHQRVVSMSSATQPIRPAATVILVRDAPDGFETLMLRRTNDAAFAGGMYVFPGGRVDGDDHLHAYDDLRKGPSTRQVLQQRALGDEWRGFWIACIRESFEEAGVLLAYDESGVLLDLHESARGDRFASYRRALNAGETTLDVIARRERIKLAVDRIHFFNRWITPEGRPRRFDTRFFIAEAPPAQTSAHDEAETDDHIWITPSDALARNKAGTFGLMGVTERQLVSLTEHRNVASLRAMIEACTEFPVFRPVLPAS
jgi:8-oxo-dGTP pyrophosphatase MutT (NUDIX family)